jgi:viologen exporter family transport system permease protein
MNSTTSRRTGVTRLAWSFFRVSAMNELQYRANFFLQVLQSMLTLGAGLVGLAVVFSRTTELDGWTRPQLLAVMGVFTMVGGVIRTFVQPNMQRLVEDVQRGTLDYALTKPADAQTLVSIRQVQIWQGVDIIAGLVVLIVAIVQMNDETDRLQRSLSFVLLLLVGSWCVYCFWLMLAASAFWLTRVDEIQELFQGLYRSGQYPVGIYPPWMRYGLTFIVPIGFAVTVPSEAISNRLDLGTVLVALAVAVFLGVVSRWVWSRGLRRYGGASA